MSAFKFGDKVTYQEKKALFVENRGDKFSCIVTSDDPGYYQCHTVDLTHGWPREPEVWEGECLADKSVIPEVHHFLILPTGKKLNARRYKVRAEEVKE